MPPFCWASDTHLGRPQRLKGLQVQVHIPSDLLTEMGPAPQIGGNLFPLWLISEGAYNLPLVTQILIPLLSRSSGFYTLNPLPHKTLVSAAPQKSGPERAHRPCPPRPPPRGSRAGCLLGRKHQCPDAQNRCRIVNGPRERLSREEERSKTAAEGTRSSEWEAAPGRRGARRVRGYAPPQASSPPHPEREGRAARPGAGPRRQRPAHLGLLGEAPLNCRVPRSHQHPRRPTDTFNTKTVIEC